MLKSILKINGVRELTKGEQKSVKGGYCGNCDPLTQCCEQCNDGCFYTEAWCDAHDNFQGQVCWGRNCSACA